MVVCFGDFEQKKHMKYKEPIKGKGMRTLFRRNGFKTYLVDEFRTSCKCSSCEGGSCEKFMMRENPKPFREGFNLCWGLLKCKTCDGVWNRECNGATNIYKIAFNSINGKDRPNYLSRKKIYQAYSTISQNQNLHGVKPSNFVDLENCLKPAF